MWRLWFVLLFSCPTESSLVRVSRHFLFLISSVCVVWQSFSTDGAVSLSFHKNGRFMGVAFSLGASKTPDQALFPHVLCKSCSVTFNLNTTAPPWYPSPPGFTPLAALPAGQRVRTKLARTSRAQCEVRNCSWARKGIKHTIYTNIRYF